VPLIVNWPGSTPAGKVSKDLVCITDFFPTFAELAGAALPSGVTIDGRSIAPQVLGQPGKPREWVYVQLRADGYVRDVQWKLTQAGDLFDMRDAPWQEIPVSANTTDAGAKAARSRLKTVLDGLLAQEAALKRDITLATEKPAAEKPAKKKKKKNPAQ
jgi:arylsulfatase A-like enzyme